VKVHTDHCRVLYVITMRSPLSAFCSCDLPNTQNSPKQDIYFFLCITGASTCANSVVTLKKDAVGSSETSRYLTTTQFRNTSEGQHLIYSDHKNLNTDITPIQSNNATSNILQSYLKTHNVNNRAHKFQNTCNNKGIQLKGKVTIGMHLKFHNKTGMCSCRCRKS